MAGILKVTQLMHAQPWHWIDLMYAFSIAAGVYGFVCARVRLINHSR
jgi:hypothetical protein